MQMLFARKMEVSSTLLVSAGAPVQDVGDAFGDSCNDVPDVYQIGFYRMSLCSENPDPVGAAQP